MGIVNIAQPHSKRRTYGDVQRAEQCTFSLVRYPLCAYSQQIVNHPQGPSSHCLHLADGLREGASINQDKSTLTDKGYWDLESMDSIHHRSTSVGSWG